MNVIGKIGDKLQLNTNYNTEAIFDFDNKIKLEYEGEEDEIQLMWDNNIDKLKKAIGG